jgi:hypothetical protein
MIHEIWPNPECRDGKHTNCSGQGWNSIQDEPCDCPCECHGNIVK